MDQLPYLDAGAIRERLGPRGAVDALEAALLAGLDPSAGVPRSIIALSHGELLLMPAEVDGAAGVKVVTVAPDNGRHDLPRIQGLYLLLDPETLTPRAILDGIELTALRTPAVSLLAVRHRLRSSDTPLHLVVAGTGLQAVRHVEAVVAVTHDVRELASVTYVSRRPEAFGPPTVGDVRATVAAHGSPEADQALRAAHLVVCATSATDPLFDGSLIADEATVIAIGSHDPGRRELDDAVMGRSQVVVEDVSTAMREAGDVIQAIDHGVLSVEQLIPLARAVADPRVLAADRPVVFKGSGMAWQDAVVALAVLAASP